MNFGMCGRWRNGRLVDHCTMAGTEECDFECPHRDEPSDEIGKRSTSAATASGHELPNDTAAAAASLSVANGGDARVASAGSPAGVPERVTAADPQRNGGKA